MADLTRDDLNSLRALLDARVLAEKAYFESPLKFGDPGEEDLCTASIQADAAFEAALIENAPALLDAAERGLDDRTEYVLACLRNSGIDTTCGACMEVAFTGVSTAMHTCAERVMDDGLRFGPWFEGERHAVAADGGHYVVISGDRCFVAVTRGWGVTFATESAAIEAARAHDRARRAKGGA